MQSTRGAKHTRTHTNKQNLQSLLSRSHLSADDGLATPVKTLQMCHDVKHTIHHPSQCPSHVCLGQVQHDGMGRNLHAD